MSTITTRPITKSCMSAGIYPAVRRGFETITINREISRMSCHFEIYSIPALKSIPNSNSKSLVGWISSPNASVLIVIKLGSLSPFSYLSRSPVLTHSYRVKLVYDTNINLSRNSMTSYFVFY